MMPKLKYFKDIVEYPDDIAWDPLPWNVEYDYVANTFLNGFINHVEIAKAYLLDRYVDEEKIWEVNIREPANTFQWEKFEGDKQEIYDKLIEPGRTFHINLGDFGDSVLILSRIKNKREPAK